MNIHTYKNKYNVTAFHNFTYCGGVQNLTSSINDGLQYFRNRWTDSSLNGHLQPINIKPRWLPQRFGLNKHKEGTPLSCTDTEL